MRLTIHESRRFLMWEDGTPFFYLGDTAWELFHRCNRREAERYLRDRAAKGFTVVQAVALAELDGLHTPNPYGHTPLRDDDPLKPNEPYWRHVDNIIDIANRLGIVVGLLPTWGDKWNKKWGVGPEIFTPENARVYGEWIGNRYKGQQVIWILGGDRPVENERHYAVLRAMATGIRAAVGRSQLISFHPMGGQASSQYFHQDDWLDFNMVQSGHIRDNENWKFITRDYSLAPVKPCMDAEPGYENIASHFDPRNGFLSAYDVRKFAYWALFAGAHGHTYGCSEVWQMYLPGREPQLYAHLPWTEAIKLPGSAQMQHAKRLLLSRPFFARVPDQSLLACEEGTGALHIQATRAADGSYAMVYLPLRRPVAVKMDRIGGSQAVAWWYDPRTGRATRVGTFATKGEQQFIPPPAPDGGDWVLVLDEEARRFPEPGKVTAS
ncbi:MAG: glycoside hydrolase family 140 protein [bacterium]|nr:glycoside hydrolase family 140 protein [bacterium]MDW8104349.1 glycoside hydrolase family 140 protein [Armatimonadota bacterium]